MVPLCSYSYNHRAIEELYSLSSHHFPLRIWLVWLKAPLCMFGRVGSSSPFVRCTTTNCVPQRLLTRWDFLVCAFFSCFPSLIFFFWGGVGLVGLQRVQLTCYWVRLGKKDIENVVLQILFALKWVCMQSLERSISAHVTLHLPSVSLSEMYTWWTHWRRSLLVLFLFIFFSY